MVFIKMQLLVEWPFLEILRYGCLQLYSGSNDLPFGTVTVQSNKTK